MKESGIQEYVIFLDKETLALFGYMKTAHPDRLAHLREQNVMREWWAYMKDIMDTNADNSPVRTALHEVFYLS